MKHPFSYMRKEEPPSRLALCLVLISICGSSPNAIAEEQTVVANSSDVTLSVICPSSYASTKNVEIKHSVKNGSAHPMKTVHANIIYDLKVVVISPDGRQVPTFPYDNDTFTRFSIRPIAPGEERAGDTIDLADYFPFAGTGEYLCNFIRQIYKVAPDITPSSAHDLQGYPINIAAPEITFRIESLDPERPLVKDTWPGARQGVELDGIRNRPPVESSFTNSANREAKPFTLAAWKNICPWWLALLFSCRWIVVAVSPEETTPMTTTIAHQSSLMHTPVAPIPQQHSTL